MLKQAIPNCPFPPTNESDNDRNRGLLLTETVMVLLNAFVKHGRLKKLNTIRKY